MAAEHAEDIEDPAEPALRNEINAPVAGPVVQAHSITGGVHYHGRTQELPLGSLLLPIESNGWFVVPGDTHGDDREKFGFDPHILSIFAQELIGHGATSIVIHSASAYADNVRQLHPSLAPYVRTVDAHRRTEDRALNLLRPVASDLGFNVDELAVINDPVLGPQRLSLGLPPDRRSAWSDLLRALHGTYQFLLGMQAKTQIDVSAGR